MKPSHLLLAVIITLGMQIPLEAAEPGWWGVVIARGPDRAWIDSTPILQRPYRPFHFYGNTIRRSYYRGNSAPLPRDIANGARVLISRDERMRN